MDEESSTKFIGSLTKFLQSLCNGYVEFEDGVELIGHIYLSVDAGRSGKKLNYFLNEKVCKNDNSVTFISNSFHAQPESKGKGQTGKDGTEGKKDDEAPESVESVPKSTNSGTIPSRTQMSSRSAPSPGQSRSGVQIGTKRPGSPLSAPTAPSQRRMQSSAVKSSVGSPVSKTVPSSPSSSSQDNIPSPSPARKNRSEISQPPSNQSDNVSIDNEGDIVSSNIMTINPPPDFASFIGSLTSDNQTSRDQRSPPDMKPDTDVTFIKEEFVSEPSCAQTGSSGQSGRSGDDLYPVMLHQNTSVFPSTSSAYPSATATSQHPGFSGASTSQSDPFNPQDGADPSVSPGPREIEESFQPGTSSSDLALGDEIRRRLGSDIPLPHLSSLPIECGLCGKVLRQARNLRRHHQVYHQNIKFPCDYCDSVYTREDKLSSHLRVKHGVSRKTPCAFCDKTFWSKQSLLNHEEKVHNICQANTSS